MHGGDQENLKRYEVSKAKDKEVRFGSVEFCHVNCGGEKIRKTMGTEKG